MDGLVAINLFHKLAWPNSPSLAARTFVQLDYFLQRGHRRQTRQLARQFDSVGEEEEEEGEEDDDGRGCFNANSV